MMRMAGQTGFRLSVLWICCKNDSCSGTFDEIHYPSSISNFQSCNKLGVAKRSVGVSFPKDANIRESLQGYGSEVVN